MSTAKDSRAGRVRRWARGMEYACLGLALVLPVAAAVHWLSVDASRAALALGVQRADLGPLQRALGLMIVLAPPAAHALGLIHLRGAFSRFAVGEVFSAAAALALRRFSAAVALAAILALLAYPALQLLVTAPTGHLQWGVNISPSTLSLLLMAGAVWVFAQVLILSAQAHDEVSARERQLADENARFI